MQEKKGSEKREVLLISFSISARFVFAIIYGAKIYKGRWVMNNTFSYPKEHKPKFE